MYFVGVKLLHYDAETANKKYETHINEKYSLETNILKTDGSILDIDTQANPIDRYLKRYITSSSSTINTTSGSSQLAVSGTIQSAGTSNSTSIVGTVTSKDLSQISDGTTTWTLIDAGTLELGQRIRVIGIATGNNLTVTQKTIFKRTYPRVLMIGDSITLSQPTDWSPSSPPARGMNATTPANDYTHKMVAQMETVTGNASVSQIGGQYGGTLQNSIDYLSSWENFYPDLVTVQLGENDSVSDQTAIDAFTTKYTTILDTIATWNGNPRIFCFGVWNFGPTSYDAGSAEVIKEGIIKTLADARNIPFRSLESVAHATPETGVYGQGGILWHPNDYGHDGYYNLFWETLGPEISGSF